MKKIILASKSIDRAKVLRYAKIPFCVIVSGIDENPYKEKFLNDPVQLVKELAKAKALNAKKKLLDADKDALIIAADTIVEFNGEIIGKSYDEIKAFDTLKKLSGNVHKLITGIAITETNDPKIIIDYESTKVEFLNLSDEEIWKYIKTNEWKGRAGAYSIAERASLVIKSINGSHTNVIGLPLNKVYEIVKKEFDVDLLQQK